MKHLLLVYYHPVIFDLAESFSRLFDKITIAVNSTLKDNYGSFEDVKTKVKSNPYLKNIECIPLKLAQLKIKDYSLVGLDGVFDGDKLTMDLCKEKGVPYFCINGYPHQLDEPSENILAFSWFLPQGQYRQKYPHEGYVKEVDWKNISENGFSDGKNICVYYPEMNESKRYYSDHKHDGAVSDTIVSFIHRYEECNRWNYEVFEKAKKDFSKLGYSIENYSKLPQAEVFEKMHDSAGLLHLKHADCPGISILESLILGRPIITFSSFIKASFNQEVLIDSFNSIIADSYEELIGRSKDLLCFYEENITQHSWMLTDFYRQRNKLERFFGKCLNK